MKRSDLIKAFQASTQDQIFKKQLDSGLTLLACQREDQPLISTQVWVRAGSIYEGQWLGTGISHYLEHMMFKGTDRRSYDQIAKEIHDFGGTVNAYTTFDRTVYYIDGPSSHTDEALDILSDIVLHSKIDLKETEQEQSVILREIDMTLDDPDGMLMKRTLQTCFRTHPYRYPVIGEKNLFKTLKRDDLWAYYKKFYSPYNMTLIVVGDFDWDTLQEQVEQRFAVEDLVAPQQQVIPTEPLPMSPREFRMEDEVTVSRGVITFPVPSMSHEDAPALNLLARMLGKGQSSLLWQEFRETRNLVHSIGASLWNPGSTGLLTVDYTCEPSKQAEAETEILKRIYALKSSDFKSKDLDKTITQCLVGEINTRKTISGLAGYLGLCDFVIGDLNYSKTLLDKFQATPVKSIFEIAKKYFDSTKVTVSSLNPKQKNSATKKSKTSKGDNDFKQFVLNNGVRLFWQKDPKLPKVALHTASLGGPWMEPEAIKGATGVLATLMTKDTQKDSAAALAEKIEGHGAGFGEFVGNNSFGFKLEMMQGDQAMGAEVLEQALLHPKLLAKEFEIEREAQLASLNQSMDEIFDRGFLGLRRKFFKKNPLSYPSLGDKKALELLKVGDVKNLRKSLVCGNNLCVAISGDLNDTDIKKHWVPVLEKIPVSKEFIKPMSTGLNVKALQHQEKFDKEQVVVFLAYPGLSARDTKDMPAASILDDLFSGLSSNLFIEVREKQGLAYYVGSSQLLGYHQGMFFFYAGTHIDHYEKVQSLIRKEIKRIQSGKFTDAELNRAKNRISVAHQTSLQAPSGRTSLVSLNSLLGMPHDEWKVLPERVSKVTKQDVQALANKLLIPEKEVAYSIGAFK